jgi:hypothetical protein
MLWPVGFICCTIIIAAGCVGTSAPTIAPCITTRNSSLVIEWGEENDSTQTRTTYWMNTRGELRMATAPFATTPSSGTKTDTVYLLAVDHPEYCNRVQAVQDAFLQTQALNIRGKRSVFLVYANQSSSVYLRSVWNPELPNFQNRVMRAEFEALMALVPTIERE